MPAESRAPFCTFDFSSDGKLLATGVSSGEEVALIWDISPYGLARKLNRNPFDTPAEYEARGGQIEIPYSETVTLNAAQYDADRGRFEIQFKNNKLLIQVEREVAKELDRTKNGDAADERPVQVSQPGEPEARWGRP